jgi:hypothetical protein
MNAHSMRSRQPKAAAEAAEVKQQSNKHFVAAEWQKKGTKIGEKGQGWRGRPTENGM